MYSMKTERSLFLLLVLNASLFGAHIIVNYQNALYFCQMTNMTSLFVVANFVLSIILHEKKSSHATRRFLSSLHLMTLSMSAIVFIGFWGLRVFFNKGIIDPREKRTLVVEALSAWVHGGSLLTMFYFIKTDQIVLVKQKSERYLTHLSWAFPYMILQFIHWHVSGEHVYGFLKFFSWTQLIVFQAALFYIAVSIDYSLNLRHGLKLTLKCMGEGSISQLQLQKEREETEQYLQKQRKAKEELDGFLNRLKHKQISTPI